MQDELKTPKEENFSLSDGSKNYVRNAYKFRFSKSLEDVIKNGRGNFLYVTNDDFVIIPNIASSSVKMFTEDLGYESFPLTDEDIKKVENYINGFYKFLIQFRNFTEEMIENHLDILTSDKITGRGRYEERTFFVKRHVKKQ